MNRIVYAWVLSLFIVILTSASCRADGAGTVEERMNGYLAGARVSEGVQELSAELIGTPENDQLRLATGFLQFAEAVQTLGQSWYRYGLRTDSEFARSIPFLRIPVPHNPDPKPISNGEARQILARFVEDLMAAEKTLSGINSEAVKLGVHIGRGHLDFNSSGEGEETEALWTIYAKLNRRVKITKEQADTFLVRLDAGDVYWLRGYCHLLTALLDFYLAHDDSQLFDHTAQLFFSDPVTSYPFLRQSKPGRHDYTPFIDAIALIHLLNLPVADASRSEAALGHLEQVVSLSRTSWDLYEKETDDDCEWIPNSNQTGVVPGVNVTEDMVVQWRAFLDEAESLLAGENLIPFWRGEKPLGVNLRRVFTEPETFDLVLWVQGTGAVPYLEEGRLTDPNFWSRLMRTFNGQFVGFALWFN